MNKIYKIEGMTCASCSQIIEEQSANVPGINSIQVNFASEKAELSFDDGFKEDQFFELMQKLGYKAVSLDSLSAISENESFFNQKFYQSCGALLIGIFSMSVSMGPGSQIFSMSVNNITQLLLATFVLFFWGKQYLLSVVHFIKGHSSNMNTLIGLGVLAAYLYSISLMILTHHAHVYFETIPFIIGFTLFGHFLEEKAKTKARSSLSSLYKMQIKFASKMVDNKEINFPVIDLVVGDIIRLRPGDKIPLDSIVVEGSSHSDESMITGESKIVSKKIGDKVFAGSLNIEGSLLIKVEKILHQSFISDIAQFVEKAQLNKAPIQKYADKIVQYFVPVIMITSLVTFLLWFILNPIGGNERSYEAFSHMIAVLLIACPCALGLAVPMAVMLGTAEAAKSGLLISGGDVIERAHDINVVVFDKTGTLTEGRPIVSEFETLIEVNEFFKLAGSITQYSNHPLSKSITQFIELKNIKLSDPDKFINHPGLGIEGYIDGKKILLGNAKWLHNENIMIPENDMVGSFVYMAIDQKYAGFFIIADPLKKEAKKTIELLTKLGIDVWMLTGDNHRIAKKIADEISIKNIKAEVKPIEKAEFIKELTQKGFKVAMIGDGINDAPALSSAHLSMAMASGSDIAIAASDVSILEGKIECVAQFFELSNKTMRVIKENLFLSFFYNLLCIPLAAGLLWPWFHLSLTPMWASLAMGLSSFSVVLSSLRLKRPL